MPLAVGVRDPRRNWFRPCGASSVVANANPMLSAAIFTKIQSGMRRSDGKVYCAPRNIWIDPTPVVLWLSAHPVGRSPLLESYSGKASLTARLFFGVVVLDNYRYNVLYFFYTLIGAGAKHLLPHALIVGFPDHYRCIVSFFYTLIGAGAKHLLLHVLIAGFPDHL